MTRPSGRRQLRGDIMRALDHAGAFCGDCHREPGDPWMDCPQCVRVIGNYADAVLGIVRTAKAESWDECAEESSDWGYVHESDLAFMKARNPYREEASPPLQ